MDKSDIKAVQTEFHEQLPAVDESPAERAARFASRATLQNALHGIAKPQLFAEVDQFCVKYGLTEHQAVFRKGALVAQRPRAWEAIEELDAEERAYIEREHKHR